MNIFFILLISPSLFALEGYEYLKSVDQGKYEKTDAIGLGKYDRININDKRTIELQQKLEKLEGQSQQQLNSHSQDLSTIKENQKKIQQTLYSLEQRLEKIEKRVYGDGESMEASQ
jgi:predicted nuclease with TOPRIM domain